MSYDTAQFYNAALAIFVGCTVAPLSFLVVPPLSPEFRAKRLLRLTLRDLRRLAINPLPMEPEDWQGRIHSRLAGLPDAAEPLQRAQLLAAFSVGTEIIHLRRIMPELGLAQELESTLQSLSRGDSVAATAQLAALDHRLASIVNFSAQGSLAMRARGRILVVSDALADHREYFEGESA